MNSQHVVDKQSKRLELVIEWAKKSAQLSGCMGDTTRPVWFRPASTGITMVGLTHEAPQLGRRISVDKALNEFESEYDRHCRAAPARKTPEKQVQSHLIRQALQDDQRCLLDLSEGAKGSDAPAALYFVTDELKLPLEKGEIACDVLAVCEVGTGYIPIVIELKSDRQMKRLVEQVTDYAALVDAHWSQFESLFDSLLPFPVKFASDERCQKWIVWPKAGNVKDPRREQLANLGIRTVGYEIEDDSIRFRVESFP